MPSFLPCSVFSTSFIAGSGVARFIPASTFASFALHTLLLNSTSTVEERILLHNNCRLECLSTELYVYRGLLSQARTKTFAWGSGTTVLPCETAVLNKSMSIVTTKDVKKPERYFSARYWEVLLSSITTNRSEVQFEVAWTRMVPVGFIF